MITEELDFGKVMQAVRKLFTGAFELTRTESGQSTYVYRITQDRAVYYLRILPEDASFAAEALAHALLRKADVNVPRVLFVEHVNPQVGKSLMLTEEMPGCCLGQDANAPAVLFEAGRQLARIGCVQVDGFGWIDRKSHGTLKGVNPTFYDYYFETLADNINLLGQYGFDTEGLLRRLTDAFPLFDTKEAVLVHGDFDDTHVFHVQGQYTGIIDLGEIRGGHALYDLGHYKLHDTQGHSPYLMKGFSTIRPFVPGDEERIDLWSLYIAVMRSKYPHYRRLLRQWLETHAV